MLYVDQLKSERQHVRRYWRISSVYCRVNPHDVSISNEPGAICSSKLRGVFQFAIFSFCFGFPVLSSEDFWQNKCAPVCVSFLPVVYVGPSAVSAVAGTDDSQTFLVRAFDQYHTWQLHSEAMFFYDIPYT